MKINPRLIGDVIVLELDGQLEIGDDSIGKLREQISKSDCKRFLIDLAKVSTVDDTSAGELEQLAIERKIKLLNLTKRIQNARMLRRLALSFENFGDLAAAVRSF